MAGGGAVPAIESAWLDTDARGPAAGQLIAVTLAGAVLGIDLSHAAASGTATCAVLIPAIWDPASAARLVDGLATVDQASRTLYAVAALPTPGQADDPVCGSTHGLTSCPASIFSVQLPPPSLEAGAAARAGGGGAPAGRNLTSLLYCFDGGNNVLSCKGTNFQSLYFDPASQRLVGLARNFRLGPFFASVSTAPAPVANITSLAPLPDVLEFLTGGDYFMGVDQYNPSALDARNSTLYAHLRLGSRRFLFGVSSRGC